MIIRIPILVMVVLPGLPLLPGHAQDQAPRPLLIQRNTVPNFLTDPIVTGNASKLDDVSATLPSTFIMTSPVTGQSIYWSPPLCRVLAIKKGKLASFRELIAEGPHPISLCLGAIGRPRYFGFRLVEGTPEFLYTYGQLSVEERFAISDDGRSVLQTFKITSNAMDGAFGLSPAWREVATADTGKWNNNVLLLSREELKKGFTITYHLDPSQLN
jgi:hypothetical protein